VLVPRRSGRNPRPVRPNSVPTSGSPPSAGQSQPVLDSASSSCMTGTVGDKTGFDGVVRDTSQLTLGVFSNPEEAPDVAVFCKSVSKTPDQLEGP
jgi:hypothetical protein